MRFLTAQRQRHRESDDDGFTLIELLIVIAILPLIVGAIAAALIVSLDSERSAQNRLSDSVDAELSAAYFVRDIQGAGYITSNSSLSLGKTGSGSPISFGALAPQVCGPSSVMGGSALPAGVTLLVAVYHPPTTGNALSAAYWRVGTAAPYQIVRYSCTVTVTPSASVSTAPVAVTIADNVSSTAVPATIQPSQFQTGAASGWVPSIADATVQAVSGSTLTIAPSTTGFAPNGTVKVVNALGSQLATCSVTGTTSLSCTGATVSADDTVSQDSVQAVDIAVSQSPSSLQTSAGAVEYHYRLAAAPRTQADWGAGPGTSPVGPNPGGGTPPGPNLDTLVVLSPSGVSLNGNTNLSVTGVALIDGGPITCTGGSHFTATGGVQGAGSTSSGSGCPSTTPTSFERDPLADFLPSCFPQQRQGGQISITLPGGAKALAYTPGRYTSTILPTNAHGTFYFEPGVYEFDGGLSVSNNQTITIDPNTKFDPDGHAEGVLFYVPGPPAPNSPGTCASSTSNPSFSLGAQGTGLDLPPLTLDQAMAAFNDQYVAGMWAWQDQSNANPSSLGGGSTAASNGLAYLPSSVVTVYGGAGAPIGRLICAGLNLQGGSTVQLSG